MLAALQRLGRRTNREALSDADELEKRLAASATSDLAAASDQDGHRIASQVAIGMSKAGIVSNKS
jgi:hypothetical protein